MSDPMVQTIDALGGQSLVRWPNAHPMEAVLTRMLNEHMEGPDAVKVSTAASLSVGGEEVFRGRVDLLRVIAQRAAEAAANGGGLARLRAGLYALGLDNFEEESRESLLIMPLLYRAAEVAGFQPQELFSYVASRSLPQSSKFILEFAARSPAGRSLESMGYDEEQTATGLRFIRRW